MSDLMYWIGMAAVAANAITGVLEAGRKPIDLIGILIAALAAALGGGSLRDMLLDRTVFWIADQTYLIVTLLTGLVMFGIVRFVRLPPNLFLIPDALALALFTIVGTQIALQWHAPWLVASLLGVITSVFGGVLRDILCNEVPLIFHSELYASAAWGGALLFIALQALGVPEAWAAGAGMGAILLTRWAAVAFSIAPPKFTARQ